MAFNYRMEQTPLPAKAVAPKVSPSIPDKRSIQDRKRQQEELNDRLAYTHAVYGGGLSTYKAHQANIDAQYEYNQKRSVAGLPQLTIADPAWNPQAHSDDANEALDLWRKRHGSLPDHTQRLGFNRLLHLYKAEKAMHGQDSTPKTALTSGASPTPQATSAPGTFAGGLSQLHDNANDTTSAAAQQAQRTADQAAAARTPTGGSGGGGAWESEPFDPLNLIGAMGGNPYRELSKVAPEGIRGPLSNAADIYEWPYWPSNIVRDHVLPIPGMLAKNGIKALDDAVEGKPLEFDPDISAYELMWRSAEAARRSGDTEAADALELLLSNPAGGRILGSLGEIAADPLTYVNYAGILKAIKFSKAQKAAEAADIAADVQPVAKAAVSGDVPLIRSVEAEAAALQASPLDDTAGLADSVTGEATGSHIKGNAAGLPGVDGQTQPAQISGMNKDIGQYSQKVKWGFQEISVRPEGKGFFGKRTPQSNPRVDAYEQKINTNNESYYLKHPTGSYVQFENMLNNVVMDGKLIIQQKSFYHVNDLPEFAKNKVFQEAIRQVEAAREVGYTVEWLVSDSKAVSQLTDFFRNKYVNITVKYLPE